MKNSLMQLRTIHLERFLLEANEDFDASDEQSVGLTTAKIARLARADENESLWKVELDIRVRRKRERTPPPYKIDVRLSGVFEAIYPKLDDLELARVVGVNGASILYSAAREHVYLLTSRGRWGTFQLPVVSFAGLKVTSLAEAGDEPGH